MVSSPVAWKHSLRSLQPCCRVYAMSCWLGTSSVVSGLERSFSPSVMVHPLQTTRKSQSMTASFTGIFDASGLFACSQSGMSQGYAPTGIRSPFPSLLVVPSRTESRGVESRLSILSGGVIPLNLARSSGLRSCRHFSSRSALVCDGGQVWW